MRKPRLILRYANFALSHNLAVKDNVNDTIFAMKADKQNDFKDSNIFCEDHINVFSVKLIGGHRRVKFIFNRFTPRPTLCHSYTWNFLR